MMQSLKLSVSKCKTFADCKKKYEYAYILKLPAKEFSFHKLGKFCHKVLEDFHLALINGSQESHHKIMGKAFNDAMQEYQLDPEMKKECYDLIDKYLKILSSEKKNNISANVIACERRFELGIEDKILLNGCIDRVQLDSDNVIHLADYKTTKNKKYITEDWFQLLTYAYVIYLENPNIEKVRASYILLRHDFEYITKEFSIQDILKVKDEYLNYYNKICQEKDYLPSPSMLCEYCSYLDLCDAGKQKVSHKIKKHGEVDW